jgi:hypothetical protein
MMQHCSRESHSSVFPPAKVKMLQRAESGRKMAIFKIIFLLGEKTSKIQ